MKRIVTLQDISCVGKCSLTVALPIISAMGIEACPVPTAVLSNHTAFSDFSFFDLSDQVSEISKQFKKQQFSFDGIYSAYLGSAGQIKLVSDFIDSFKKENTLVLVDPVMGDHGKLYSGFDEDFPSAMGKLCSKADIIVPNVTEAGFLLNKGGMLEYSTPSEVKAALSQLSEKGPKTVIMTGYEENGCLGACAYNGDSGDFFTYLKPKIPRTFHGTGDIFASVLFSCLTKGYSLNEAVKAAVDFTYAAMQATLNDPSAAWYGVNFEAVLPQLMAYKEIT